MDSALRRSTIGVDKIRLRTPHEERATFLTTSIEIRLLWQLGCSALAYSRLGFICATQFSRADRCLGGMSQGRHHHSSPACRSDTWMRRRATSICVAGNRPLPRAKQRAACERIERRDAKARPATTSLSPICHSCDRIGAPMRQDDATEWRHRSLREPMSFLAKSMSVSLALTCLRLAGLARRRVQSGRTDSVRNGTYQGRSSRSWTDSAGCRLDASALASRRAR
jgi:hypothetical protein